MHQNELFTPSDLESYGRYINQDRHRSDRKNNAWKIIFLLILDISIHEKVKEKQTELNTSSAMSTSIAKRSDQKFYIFLLIQFKFFS